MNVSSDNREYKVISLFIKTAIFLFSFWFIYHKLKTTSIQFNITEAFRKGDSFLLFLTVGLMFINWGLEALKWKFLIRPMEEISFLKAMRSVFAGVTVSIFMPNRIGEFAGRIFFLEKADKIEATLKNFIGSVMQLTLTVFLGIAAIFIFIQKGLNNSINIDYFYVWPTRITLIFFVLLLTSLLFLNRFRSRFSEKIQMYFKTVFDTPRKDLIIVFIISFFRYVVFLTQYLLVLRAFGIGPDLITGSVLIAITFLVTSIIPSFALTEIATRGAAAVFLFNTITDNSMAIVTASFIVWLINLALPAILGTIFIWKLKFFK